MTALNTISVTFFKDVFAKPDGTTKIDLTWEDLCNQVQKPKQRIKKNTLQLIKMATFGDHLTDAGSTRNDANVIEIFGVEGDYDGGEISIEEAANRLEKHGIEAILYTSPSHTPDKPRWRILAPLSECKQPEERVHYMGMINAALGGILAGESFTLSQAYYFGKATEISDLYQSIKVNGEPIDFKDDQWDPVFYRPVDKDLDPESRPYLNVNSPINEKILERINAIYSNASGYYQNSMSLTALYFNSGLSIEQARAATINIMLAHPNPNPDIGFYIEKVNGFLSTPNFAKEEKEREEKMAQADAFTERLLARMQEKRLKTMTVNTDFVLTATDFLSGARSPHFILERVLQKNQVYSATAKWGHGKTAVFLTMAIHLALGRDFADFRALRSKVLYLAGENPDDIRLRVIAICKQYGFDANDLDGWLYFSRSAFAINKDAIAQSVADQVNQHGVMDVVFVDTGPAHHETEEENSNTEMHKFAVACRSFGHKLGEPAVVVFMHPTQGSTKETLRSRGGGGFAGNIDAELLLWQDESTHQVEFWHSTKFRGAGFDRKYFDLKRIELPQFVDNFGNVAISVAAIPAEAVNAPKDIKKLKGAQKIIFNLIESGSSCEPTGRVLKLKIRDAFYQTQPELTPMETLRKAFKRACDSLRIDLLIAESPCGNFLSLTQLETENDE